MKLSFDIIHWPIPFMAFQRIQTPNLLVIPIFHMEIAVFKDTFYFALT